MANLNFDTSVTDWTTNSGSATAVPNSIPKTQFESMLAALTPQSDFFDRSIVCNESSSGSKDFKVKSATTATNSLGETKGDFALFVDTTADVGVGIGGTCYTDYELTTHGSVRIVGDATSPNTELYLSDSAGSATIHAISSSTGASDRGQFAAEGVNGARLDLTESGSSTHPRFTLITHDDKTRGQIYNTSNSLEHSPFEIDHATGNVGIGGAASTSDYELKVSGSQWILGDNSGTDTELYIQDTSAVAKVIVDGDTGSFSHFYTRTSGEAEIFLTTTATTVGATNNSFNIRNNGTTSDFVVYDYDTTNGHTTGSGTAISINNATGNVGIGVSAHSTAPVITDDLSTGKIWAARSSDITFKGPSATDNPASGEYVTAQLAVDGTGWDWFEKGISVAGSASWSTESNANSPTSEYRDIFKGIAKEYTLLNGAIDSSSTADITVDDTTGFPASGNIKIEDEVISYTGTTATTFTGIGRGASSSTAAAHADNATVSFAISNTVSLIDGPEQSHIAIAIRGNDVNDSFTILGSPYPTATDDEGNASDWHYTPMNLLQVTKESVVVNEHGNDIDFRVESNNNANMLLVDGGNDAVGIGGAVNTTTATGLAYKLTVNGDLCVQDDDGYTLAIFEQTSATSPQNATVIVKAANSATLQLFDSGASADMGIYNVSANGDSFSVGTIDDDGANAYVMFDTYRQTISSTQYIVFKHNMIPPASVLSSLPVGAIYEDSGTLKIKT